MSKARCRGYSFVRLLLTASVSLGLVSSVHAQSINPFKGIKLPFSSKGTVAPASYNGGNASLPQLKMPQVNMPQLQTPKMNFPQPQMPQAALPQMNMPQMNMPSLQGPRMPQMNLESLKQQFVSAASAQTQGQRGGLGGMVDKWNQSTKAFFDKTRDKLTLKGPMAGSTAGGLNLPFGNNAGNQAGLRSLLPSLTQQQVPAQPPTLQNWFGQPKP